MKRRDFIAGASSAIALATASKISAQVLIGSSTLETVSDGNLVLPSEFLFGPETTDDIASFRKAFGLDGDLLKPECNLALYRDDERTVLFDVGSGPDFMPSSGKIVDSLEALSLAPEDITHVVFTHAHPDHIWGFLDEFDEPLFSEATYMMGRTEWDYWWNPSTVETIDEARVAFAVGAKRRMEAMEEAVEFFDDGDEVLPGISAIASFGHTPGHMAFEVRQGGDAALIVGDAIGNQHVAFAKPDFEGGPDQDPSRAVTTRKMLLDRLASEQMLAVGFHLPNGGIGRVEAKDGAYQFIPESS